MSDGPGYHNRQMVLAVTICNLLRDLGPSTSDKIAPKIEYWIEYGLTEQFTTVDDLVERVSPVVWDTHGSHPHIAQFLKGFREAPHRSEQARSFVDGLCLHILRWFAVASGDDLWANPTGCLVSRNGGPGFRRAASFVGHLIERGLLGHEPVRCHLSKPLTTHHYNNNCRDILKQAIIADAIHSLFTITGDTLLQGFLEPEDVQAFFKSLETRIAFGKIGDWQAFSAERLNVRRGTFSMSRVRS